MGCVGLWRRYRADQGHGRCPRIYDDLLVYVARFPSLRGTARLINNGVSMKICAVHCGHLTGDVVGIIASNRGFDTSSSL